MRGERVPSATDHVTVNSVLVIGAVDPVLDVLNQRFWFLLTSSSPRTFCSVLNLCAGAKRRWTLCSTSPHLRLPLALVTSALAVASCRAVTLPVAQVREGTRSTTTLGCLWFACCCCLGQRRDGPCCLGMCPDSSHQGGNRQWDSGSESEAFARTSREGTLQRVNFRVRSVRVAREFSEREQRDCG